MLLRSMIAVTLMGATSASWSGKVLDVATQNGNSNNKINVSQGSNPQLALARRVEAKCSAPQQDYGSKNTPTDKKLPANSIRIGDGDDVKLDLDSSNGKGEIAFSPSFAKDLKNCKLKTSVSGGDLKVEISGGGCNWGIHSILVKGGNDNAAKYTYSGYCDSVSGSTLTGQDVSNYVVIFKEIDSGGVGDPIITTFDGVQYRVDIRGSFLNTRWHNDQHQITSCFYSPREPAIFTRAISYRCGTTNMVAHLAKSTLDNWQTDDLSTPVKYNVYYFDDEAGTLLNNTGDFGKSAAPPGEYARATQSKCPLDIGKVQLTVYATRNKWQHEAGMALLNSKIRLIQEEGKVPNVNGGLSQYITSFLTNAAQVETKYGWSTDENARFFAGPNTNGEACSQEGIKFTGNHNEFLSSNCGAASWAIKDQENVFNRLARLPGSDVSVQSCELQEYIPVY